MGNNKSETTQKRAWYKRKTDIGVWVTIAGEILAFVPVTAPYAPILIKIGAILAGVGVVHRNLKEAK